MPTISVEHVGSLPRLHVSAERKERPDPPDRAFRFSGCSILVLHLLYQRSLILTHFMGANWPSGVVATLDRCSRISLRAAPSETAFEGGEMSQYQGPLVQGFRVTTLTLR